MARRTDIGNFCRRCMQMQLPATELRWHQQQQCPPNDCLADFQFCPVCGVEQFPETGIPAGQHQRYAADVRRHMETHAKRGEQLNVNWLASRYPNGRSAIGTLPPPLYRKVNA